jgi:hypothetical protein
MHFDEICQIRNEDLYLADRVASLTLVGWRIFSSFSRVAISRASDLLEAVADGAILADQAGPRRQC